MPDVPWHEQPDQVRRRETNTIIFRSKVTQLLSSINLMLLCIFLVLIMILHKM